MNEIGRRADKKLKELRMEKKERLDAQLKLMLNMNVDKSWADEVNKYTSIMDSYDEEISKLMLTIFQNIAGTQ